MRSVRRQSNIRITRALQDTKALSMISAHGKLGNSMTLPPKIQGIIFTEIVPQFLDDFDSKKLVELGAVVGQRGRIPLYEPLTDSLRKTQWVRLVGIKAILIEKSILEVKRHDPNIIVLSPIKFTAHALCVTDCLIHTKSALDSMAVFLTDLVELKQKGGDRDFKKLGFRQAICQKDAFLKHGIKKLEPWFLELQGIRDEWIHRSSIRCGQIIGTTEVGILPIPKKITGHFADQGKLTASALTKENFWSTEDFVNHHYENLRELFLMIIDRALQIEKQHLSEPIIIPADAERRMAMFPVFVTEKLTIEKMILENPKSLVDW
jgi:hypothetical protein